MMRWQDLPLSAILFTHFEEATGEQTDIAVSEIEKNIEYFQLEEVLIPIIPAHAELCLAIRGIEDHRLKRLMQHAVQTMGRAHPLFSPIMLAEWPGGTHLIIDGSHRYVAAYKLGYKLILAKAAPQALWRHFQVKGLPKEQPAKLINSFSGLI